MMYVLIILITFIMPYNFNRARTRRGLRVSTPRQAVAARIIAAFGRRINTRRGLYRRRVQANVRRSSRIREYATRRLNSDVGRRIVSYIRPRGF